MKMKKHKKKTKENISDKIYLWLYYIAMFVACMGMSLAFVRANANSIFLQLAVIFVAAFFIISVFKRGRFIDRDDFCVVIMAGVAVCTILLKAFFYGGYMLSAPIITTACFFIIISLLLCSNYKFNYTIYFLINGVGVTLLSIGMFVYSNDLWGVVTIGAINPQTIGAWALIYAIGALLLFDFFADKIRRKYILLILEISIIALMAYFSWITDARFSVILIFALLLFRVLPPVKFMNSPLMRILVGFSPTIVVAVFEALSAFDLLNGREKIWADSLNEVLMSPLLGIGYDAVDANTYYSHNIFVDQSVLFGVAVAIIFQICISYILVKKVSKFSRRPTERYSASRIKYDAFISFLLIIISASVEGCMFSIGAGGIFVFSFCPLLITLAGN